MTVGRKYFCYLATFFTFLVIKISVGWVGINDKLTTVNAFCEIETQPAQDVKTTTTLFGSKGKNLNILCQWEDFLRNKQESRVRNYIFAFENILF